MVLGHLRSFYFTLAAAVLAIVISGEVINLTPQNIDTVLDGTRHVFIKFYAPWCGHCKSLAPIYEELSKRFSHASTRVVVAKVDADEHRELGERFSIQGYPTLKYFKPGGEPEDYRSARTLEALMEWVTNKSDVLPKDMVENSLVLNLNEQNFETYTKDDFKVALVMFYKPGHQQSEEVTELYEKLAFVFKKEPKCQIAKINAGEFKTLAKKLEVGGFPTLRAFSPHTEEAEEFTSEWTIEKLVKFANMKCYCHRNTDGTLNKNAGSINDLNLVLSAFYSTDKLEERLKHREEFLRKATSPTLDPVVVGYYAKVLEKVLEDPQYPHKEHERLNNLITRGAIKDDKIDDFYIRRNIVDIFIQNEKSHRPEAKMLPKSRDEL